MDEVAIREEQEARPPFTVDDDAKAEWCLQQIKNRQAEIDKWTSHYASQLETMTKSLKSDIDYFTGLLGVYMTRQIDAGVAKQTKVQSSYTLPGGKLILKKQEPKFDVDSEKLLAWAKEHCPQFVKVVTEETPMWGELKKVCAVLGTSVFDENGEEVEGVTAVERPDIFRVEVK